MSIELFAIGSSGLALAMLVIMVVTRRDISLPAKEQKDERRR